MRSVESIYQELKAYYELYNAQVDEQRLRQMAWMKRDRMMCHNQYQAVYLPVGQVSSKDLIRSKVLLQHHSLLVRIKVS